MENIGSEVIFYIIAAVMTIFSVMAVTTKHLLRSATYLLFVLFGTAALYFQLEYEFLGAVQVAVYAGGIVVLFVFSIPLTQGLGQNKETVKKNKLIMALSASVIGLIVCGYSLFTHVFPNSCYALGEDITMKRVGEDLLGSGQYQYVLPFELISVLLLACIIGGIMIARKR
ncbi:MAG: NADH-quinone oxidoreductase subunit J [Bacteroidaceae bacterium]|nr:NADH-quinone oxidoreductase subunit J [Bacteroidaceae bacterium]